VFEHLLKEELRRTCDALQVVFAEHAKEFIKNDPLFTDIIMHGCRA